MVRQSKYRDFQGRLPLYGPDANLAELESDDVAERVRIEMGRSVDPMDPPGRLPPKPRKVKEKPT